MATAIVIAIAVLFSKTYAWPKLLYYLCYCIVLYCYVVLVVYVVLAIIGRPPMLLLLPGRVFPFVV